MKRIGIIDLGSNSTRLVVYDINVNGSYRPCYRMKKNIQLARYLTDDGRMSPEGILQAVASTNAFRYAGRLYQIDEWVAVATAAIRQAENGEEVLDVLSQESKLHFRLLTGEQEAWYGYLGVINTVDIEDAVLVDVGGASTEIMLVRDRQLLHAASLPFGALTLKKRFDHVTPSLQTQAVSQYFSVQLSKLEWLREIHDLPVIGIGGTMRAIAKIASKIQGSSVSRLHGFEVESTTLREIYEKIGSSTIDQRKKVGDLSETRAEVIHTGVAVTWALAETISANRLIISGCGLREGLLYELLLCDYASPVLPSVKEHSLHNFMQLYDVNLEAAYQTADRAEQLFDDLAPFHQLPLAQKKLLRVSALLMMTGAFINVEKYTRHTDYLIRSSHLYGFTQDDILNLSRVVLGKGSKPMKQLNLIIQLAKFLVHEAASRYEDVLNLTKRTIAEVKWSDETSAELDTDLLSILKGIEKHFGRTAKSK